MREILFRGKRLSDGKWIYGVPVPMEFDCKLSGRIDMVEKESYDELDYYSERICGDEVDPETVGQFTGLVDRNGTKIFEGDILESPVKRIRNKEATLLVIKDIRECKSIALYAPEYEIVGNIYDNPVKYSG